MLIVIVLVIVIVIRLSRLLGRIVAVGNVGLVILIWRAGGEADFVSLRISLHLSCGHKRDGGGLLGSSFQLRSDLHLGERASEEVCVVVVVVRLALLDRRRGRQRVRRICVRDQFNRAAIIKCYGRVHPLCCRVLETDKRRRGWTHPTQAGYDSHARGKIRFCSN